MPVCRGVQRGEDLLLDLLAARRLAWQQPGTAGVLLQAPRKKVALTFFITYPSILTYIYLSAFPRGNLGQLLLCCCLLCMLPSRPGDMVCAQMQ